MRSPFVGRRFRQAALLAALIGSAVGVYYLVKAVEIVVLFSSVVGAHNFVDESFANARGDKVETTTEGPADPNDPERSVIRLKRARLVFPHHSENAKLGFHMGSGMAERRHASPDAQLWLRRAHQQSGHEYLRHSHSLPL